MKQTNVKLNQDIKQNPNFAAAQEKYKKLVLSFANGTNYSSFTEGWNFYTDLAAILETERAYGHQDLTLEMLVNDMSKMSEKKIAKKYQAYAIGTIARYARSIEAKKYERIIKEKDKEIKDLEQEVDKLSSKQNKKQKLEDVDPTDIEDWMPIFIAE